MSMLEWFFGVNYSFKRVLLSLLFLDSSLSTGCYLQGCESSCVGSTSCHRVLLAASNEKILRTSCFLHSIYASNSSWHRDLL